MLFWFLLSQSSSGSKKKWNTKHKYSDIIKLIGWNVTLSQNPSGSTDPSFVSADLILVATTYFDNILANDGLQEGQCFHSLYILLPGIKDKKLK